MKSAERRITLTPASAEIISKNQKSGEKLSETLDRLLNLNPFLHLSLDKQDRFEDDATP